MRNQLQLRNNNNQDLKRSTNFNLKGKSFNIGILDCEITTMKILKCDALFVLYTIQNVFYF